MNQKILIIEDDPDIQQLLEFTLTQNSQKIITLQWSVKLKGFTRLYSKDVTFLGLDNKNSKSASNNKK